MSDNYGYPAVPPAMVDASRYGLGLPDAPGIYFFWDAGEVVYVGKSACLAKRVLLGPHHVMKPSYRLSWVHVDAADMVYAECFYIGTLRPRRNFATYESHYHEKREWRDALKAPV